MGLEVNMRKNPQLKPFFALILILVGVSLTPEINAQNRIPDRVKQYSESYKKNQDYRSLRALMMYLKKGMPQSEVEKLLGEPIATPVEGQHYYTTNRQARGGGVWGVILEFRIIRYDRN